MAQTAAASPRAVCRLASGALASTLGRRGSHQGKSDLAGAEGIACDGGGLGATGYDNLFGSKAPHDTVVPLVPSDVPDGQALADGAHSYDAFFGGQVACSDGVSREAGGDAREGWREEEAVADDVAGEAVEVGKEGGNGGGMPTAAEVGVVGSGQGGEGGGNVGGKKKKKKK